jgi:Tol biopolymer transport system component
VRSLVAAAIVAGVVAQPAHAATVTRLLYTSDWAGPNAIYSADPAARAATAQVSSAAAPSCRAVRRCGAYAPAPSRSGRWIAYVDLSRSRTRLYLARGDGSKPRLIAHGTPAEKVAWTRGSGRFAYEASGALFIYDVARRRSRRIDGGPDYTFTAQWSPKGDALAYIRRSPAFGSSLLMIWRSGRLVSIAASVREFVWSPDGRSIAYVGGRPGAVAGFELGAWIVRPDGRIMRRIAEGENALGALSWSADNRLIAGVSSNADFRGEIRVVDVGSGTSTTLQNGSTPIAWAPRRRLLAFRSDGLALFNADSRERRLLTPDVPRELAWSPRGDALAYVARAGEFLLSVPSDLRVATVAGAVRTVVDSAGRYGGEIASFSWVQAPPTPPHPALDRSVATMTARELVAPWQITRVAADGTNVAYVSCNHVFVWRPDTGSVRQAEPAASLKPACGFENERIAYADVFDLAIAGDRVSYGETYGCTGGQWSVIALSLDDPGGASVLGRGAGSRCGVGFDVAFGDMLGSGNVLLYSAWRGRFLFQPRPERIITSEEIRRVGVGTIATRDGPLIPLDVDDDRIAVSKGNTLAVLGAGGTELWSVPVGPTAAVFAGDELALVRDGELRRYTAATGEPLGSRSLPAVTTRRPCKTPFNTWCDTGALTVQDGARGLVAFVLDRRVHVLRLADGSDRDVGTGEMARFFDGGLVVAEGARLRVLPFAELE